MSPDSRATAISRCCRAPVAIELRYLRYCRHNYYHGAAVLIQGRSREGVAVANRRKDPEHLSTCRLRVLMVSRLENQDDVRRLWPRWWPRQTALWLARALNMLLMAVKCGRHEIRSKLIKMHLESYRFVSRSTNCPDIAVLESMSCLDSMKRSKLAP